MGNRVEIELSLNSKGFTAGLTQATSGMKSFASGLGKSMFGQFIGANFFQNAARAVVNFVQTTLKEGERIKNLSEVFGGDTTFTQQLSYDAENAGISLEKLQKTFGMLAKAREQALDGKSDFIMAFARFGITLKEIESSDPAALFKSVRSVVSGLGEDTRVTASMMSDLLRIGFQVSQIPLLKNSQSNAPFIDPESIKKLEEADSRIGKTGQDLKVAAATTIAGVYDVVEGASSPFWQTMLRPLRIMKDIIAGPINAAWGAMVNSQEIPVELTEKGKAGMLGVYERKKESDAAKIESAMMAARISIQVELVAKQDAELKIIEEKIAAEKLSNTEGVKKISILRDQLREQQFLIEQSDIAMGDILGGDPGELAKVKADAQFRSMQIQKQIRASVKDMPEGDQQNIIENEKFRLEQKLKDNESYQRDLKAAGLQGKRIGRSGFGTSGAASRSGWEDASSGMSDMPLSERRSEFANMTAENRSILAQLDALKFSSGLGDPGVGVMEGIGKAGGLVGGAVTMSNPQLRVGMDQLAVQKDMVLKLQTIVENTTQINLANEFL